MSVYTHATDEKIGTVGDALVDDQGQFCYLTPSFGVGGCGATSVLLKLPEELCLLLYP